MCRERLIGALLVAACWGIPAVAAEQTTPFMELTYEQAIAIAGERAPALAGARARVAEAESRLNAASLWPFNPELSGAAGPRDDPGGRVTDWSVEFNQRLELGGQRSHRREAARAGMEAELARSGETRRLLLREVSVTFLAALYWERRVELAQENLELAEDVFRIAETRHEMGDAGGLDEAVAELAVFRARNEVDRNAATLTQVEGTLKRLLGIAPETRLACRGDLRGLGALDLDGGTPEERPELRALRAEMRQAEAEAALGRAKRIPDLSLGAIYAREESVDIVKGAVTITLPLFDRGQGESAIAESRRERVRSSLLEASHAARVEVESARDVARTLTAAARRFEERGLSTLERAETLARGSYEAGAIPLAELLALRRELVEARQDYVDLLHQAARARVELSSSTGAIQ